MTHSLFVTPEPFSEPVHPRFLDLIAIASHAKLFKKVRGQGAR
jgi:hypothetical protein